MKVLLDTSVGITNYQFYTKSILIIFLFYLDASLMFKVINDLASPPLRGCIFSGSGSASRTIASTRGDLISHFRKTTFAQSTFSVIVVRKWNSIPTNKLRKFCSI